MVVVHESLKLLQCDKCGSYAWQISLMVTGTTLTAIILVASGDGVDVVSWLVMIVGDCA